MRTPIIFCLLLIGSFVSAAEDENASLKAAAAKAADYLIKQQNDDGTFGKARESAMPGVVGLVVDALALSPEKFREQNPAVAKAVKYILDHQQSDGAFALPEFGLENYNTSVAITALAELENPALQPALQRAKDFVLSSQEAQGGKDNPSFGGFGYGPGKKVDLSNTGFSLDALKAAGVKEDSPAWKNAIVFIKRCQDNSETNDLPAMKGGNDTGAFTYAPGESPFGTESARSAKKYVPRPYGNMTYEGVKSLIYAGIKKDDPSMQAALKWIRQNYSVKSQPGAVGNEGYFYYVVAMAKAFTAAGIKEIDLADGKKANWARDLAAQLISIQKPDGSFENSDGRWNESNPVFATAFALQAMGLCAQAMK